MLRLAALVASAATLCAQTPPSVPVLLVTGANNHDWQFTAPEIRTALEETERFQVTVTAQPGKDLAATDLAQYAAIVLDYNGPRWGEPAEQAFMRAVENGVGVVVLHAANNAFSDWDWYARLVGLCWRNGTGHGAYHPFDVVVVDPAHPITQGMADLRRHPDELYHRLWPVPGAEFRVLLSAFSDPRQGGTGRFEPMATAALFGKARVFHTPLGHTWTGQLPTRATWLDPQLRRFVARGTEWAATGACTLEPRPLNWLDDDERGQGFDLLFDGRTLAGWRGYRQQAPPESGWVVERGAIVHRKAGGGGDLVSEGEFGDFDLRFEWRIGARGNSGLIWHVLETEQETYMTGPEYQLLDDLAVNPDPRHAAGALYDLVASKEPPLRPAGAWNDGRIVVHGGRVQHWLNGKQVVDAECAGAAWQAMVADSKFKAWPFGRAAAGHLALQDHGDEVAWRNLRIRRL